MNSCTKVLKFSVQLRLRTNLLIKSGREGDFTDSEIEKTFDGRLHISGYVWSSLLRRSLARVKGGDKLAERIGKYDGAVKGVSPLWCESSFIDLIGTDVRPGNRIDRKYGSTADGGLYSDEIVPPGYILTLNFNLFCNDYNDEGLLKSAFYVINEGIENIGGGWSYGFGRLTVEKISVKWLDLTDSNHRVLLWRFDDKLAYDKVLQPPLSKPDIIKPWKKWTVKASILDGQLLAIHSSYPAFDEESKYPEYPDTFVFKGYVKESDKLKSQYIIPGKAVRQALLSTEIERKLRSLGGEICLMNKRDCSCQRCKWFGSTDKGGIIAVLDAKVTNPVPEMVYRVQLCEHSMQNVHLFSGEYLKTGEFIFEILVDCSGKESDSLIKEIDWVLTEMMKDKAPPGWNRLGATSTCTGQVEVKDFPMVSYGDTNA